MKIKEGAMVAWGWVDERIGFTETMLPMLTHIVPRDAKWWYVFGSATLCAFAVQVVTGICLAMMYVPSGSEAYESLTYIQNEAPFGALLRGMHFFGSSVMIMMAVIHMVQVFLHAAYKYPREMNWMSGITLLFFVLGMGFTGQLLRWDANGVWSVMVGAEMASRAPVVGPFIARFILGGETIGGATLSRFFVIHVFILPGMIMAGIALHLWLVLRNGISEMPKVGQPVEPKTYREDYEKRLKKTGVPFWPVAAWRDAVFSFIVVVGILICAWVFGAPTLENAPNPSSINANPMPDWYFWWYFAILSMLPRNFETWVIIGGPILAVVVLYGLPLLFNKGERAPSKRPWAVGIVLASVIGIAILSVYGYKEPWSPDFGVEPLPADVVGTKDPDVVEGAALMHTKGCLYCHNIDGYGGHRGPELSDIGQLLTREDLIIRINNGGHNMPAFAPALTSKDLGKIVDFLQTRRDKPVEPLAGAEATAETEPAKQ
ncbi:MAG: cytochrome b N-terminal domain-containing protein [Verrucomicrobiota bacterium]